VIFNSSVSAFKTSDGVTTYGLTKTALLTLVKSLSTELAPKGIRVNSVVPGQIKTRMSQLVSVRI
jgi:NAD(P)-dependent dehydrogenase (short-subunit alcohol dehydrogenase family)